MWTVPVAASDRTGGIATAFAAHAKCSSLRLSFRDLFWLTCGSRAGRRERPLNLRSRSRPSHALPHVLERGRSPEGVRVFAVGRASTIGD